MREIRWPKYQWCSLHNYNIGVDCPSCERASIANTNIEACIKAWQSSQPSLEALDLESVIKSSILYKTVSSHMGESRNVYQDIIQLLNDLGYAGTPPSGKRVGVYELAILLHNKFSPNPEWVFLSPKARQPWIDKAREVHAEVYGGKG